MVQLGEPTFWDLQLDERRWECIIAFILFSRKRSEGSVKCTSQQKSRLYNFSMIHQRIQQKEQAGEDWLEMLRTCVTGDNF